MSERVTAVGEMTSLWDRKLRAGQRLVIGISGHEVTEDERKLIRELRPAGFILFARNVAEPAQVRELNRELASLVDPAHPALLTVDQEGGRVQRVREPATVWPPMALVGRADEWREKREPPPTAHASQVARGLARELRAMGFNLNFGPVADVNSNPKNPVIGDRSFGADPKAVSSLVAAFVEGTQAEGVIACAKHFPGHGDTSVDSHLDLPIVEREDRDLREIEIPPFAAAVRAGVGSVMTSHVVYPAWDESWPATLSDRIAPRLLRKEMGFEGVLFSDDLEMRALAGRWPLPDILRRATGATVDVFLACKDPLLQIAAFEELVRQQEEDGAGDRAATDAAGRVQAMRERFLAGKREDVPLTELGRRDHRALADRVRERSA